MTCLMDCMILCRLNECLINNGYFFRFVEYSKQKNESECGVYMAEVDRKATWVYYSLLLINRRHAPSLKAPNFKFKPY